MSWKDIIKNKVPTFEETGAFDGEWEENEEQYVVSITQQSKGELHGKWATLWENNIQKFDTRDEAKAFLTKQMIRLGNPAAWTVEGSNVEGHAVIYAHGGIALVTGVPTYFYLIHKEGETLPDAKSFNPKVDWVSGSAVRDRMDKKPFGGN